MSKNSLYSSDREVEAILTKFETCTFAQGEFSHAAHLTVAVFYLSQLPLAKAAAKMRSGLQRLAQHHCAPKLYNETITIFWLRLARAHFEKSHELPLYMRTNLVIERCGDTDMLFRYYTREHILSDEARTQWLEPDLQPFN